MASEAAQRGVTDLIVVSGPSGVGKSTVVQAVLQQMPEVAFSVSATTRPPRSGETDGVAYHFISRDEFKRCIAADEFIEHAEVFGNLYGTPVEELRQARRNGQALLLEIDVQGGLQIRRKFPQALFILIVPPTLEALRQRLNQRGTDSPEVIARRFAGATQELEMARHSVAYDAEVVNDDLPTAVAQVAQLIREHRRKYDDRSAQK